jgi:hypothetical protein
MTDILYIFTRDLCRQKYNLIQILKGISFTKDQIIIPPLFGVKRVLYIILE